MEVTVVVWASFNSEKVTGPMLSLTVIGPLEASPICTVGAWVLSSSALAKPSVGVPQAQAIAGMAGRQEPDDPGENVFTVADRSLYTRQFRVSHQRRAGSLGQQSRGRQVVQVPVGGDERGDLAKPLCRGKNGVEMGGNVVWPGVDHHHVA